MWEKGGKRGKRRRARLRQDCDPAKSFNPDKKVDWALGGQKQSRA